MADILFPVILVLFFALATLLVRACDLLIGPPEHPDGEQEPR